uniref:G-patch_2 domain-containing protein n=1 Tax=Parastrongyloides trichosuri TaxID=131310 RepID=A0A0N4Z6G0_PARTI
MDEKEEIAKKMKELGHGKAKKIGSGIRVNRSGRPSTGDKSDTSDEEDVRVADNNLIFDIERNLPKKEIREQTLTKPVAQHAPKHEFKRQCNSKPVFQPQKQCEGFKSS